MSCIRSHNIFFNNYNNIFVDKGAFKHHLLLSMYQYRFSGRCSSHCCSFVRKTLYYNQHVIITMFVIHLLLYKNSLDHSRTYRQRESNLNFSMQKTVSQQLFRMSCKFNVTARLDRDDVSSGGYEKCVFGELRIITPTLNPMCQLFFIVNQSEL